VNPLTASPPIRQARHAAAATRTTLARVRHGRPAILALRTLTALDLAGTALRTGAGPAPTAGTLVGIATWFALTARADLAPPPGR
jgi:hypothetical protein